MGIIPQNISQNMELLLLASCLTLTLGVDIPTKLTSAEGATTLVDLVTLAGLGDTLAGEEPFTVFAPTNDAFAKLPASLVNTLKGDTELLKQVLLNHVVASNVKSGDITNDIVVKAVGGQDLRANIYLKSNYYDGFVTTLDSLLSDNGALTKVLLRHVVPGTVFSKG